MKGVRSWGRHCTLGALIMASSLTALAQGPPARRGDPRGPAGDDLGFSTELSVETRVVKGAPYSARAHTEITQLLPDGNTIRQSVSSVVYRDREGRTRREQQLLGPGMLGGQDAGFEIVTINDPVTNASYMLRTRDRTARNVPFVRVEPPDAPRPARNLFRDIPAIRPGRNGPADAANAPRGQRAEGSSPPRRGGQPNDRGRSGPRTATTESLGLNVIDGIAAEGTRTTQTIPAGAVGNARPIQIVTERWFSHELQIVVMTRHSDPRVGDTTYRLTNVIRAEPSPDLFAVPADYTILDDGSQPRRPLRKQD